MQDLGFLGSPERERAAPGPAKYGGTLPPVPFIHRADEVLVGLATRGALRDRAYAFAIVDSYIRGKKQRGQVPSYIASKLELLETRIPMAFAPVFIDAREWHRLPPSRVIRRRPPSDVGPSRPSANASTVSSAGRQRPASTVGVTPSVTQMAQADRRPPVRRAPTAQGSGDDLPPPPYSAEDPEPEATRALQESLAAAAEQESAVSAVTAAEFTPEPQHRRANSSTSSMVTAPTSLSRASGDRPRPNDFPASPAARVGTLGAMNSGASSNGPSAASTPAVTSPPVTSPAAGTEEPPIDTSNMDDEERRAVEESQLEEAMRASRQAEKERQEYEAAVAASLAQAEEDALRRALGESSSSGSSSRRRSDSGGRSPDPRQDGRSGSRSGRSSKRSSLTGPSSAGSDTTIRRAGSANTNKPLPNPLPPVQEPANESLMDMLSSIDFSAPNIQPIQPAPPLASQLTGGSFNSRGSFSGASGASIEATVSSPQGSSNGSWIASPATTAAPSLGTTPTQPVHIHEHKLRSNNPFLSPEDGEAGEGSATPPVGTPSPGVGAGPARPTRAPPAPPRSDTDDTVTPTVNQSHEQDLLGPPEDHHQAHWDNGAEQAKWRGTSPSLTINTSSPSSSQTAPSLSSAGATVAHLTPSSHSPTGSGLSNASVQSDFPFPVAVPSGLPPPGPASATEYLASPSPGSGTGYLSPNRPNSEYSSSQRTLPQVPGSRSAESLGPPPVPPSLNPPGVPPPIPPHPSSLLSSSPRTPQPPSSILSSASRPAQPSPLSATSAAPSNDPLALLKEYDTVFLVDDSGALSGEKWEAASHLLSSLVECAPNGLDVYFLNSKRIGKALKERADVEELFAGLVPRGGVRMGARLEALLREYMQRLEREGGGKKLNLVVMTDGVFAKPVLARARHARGIADLRHELLSSAPADDAESVLVAVGKRLDRGDYPPTQVGVQFIQLGDDQEARKSLQVLDDGLASVHHMRDMVDTVRYSPDVAITADFAKRVLLGAVCRKEDWRAS